MPAMIQARKRYSEASQNQNSLNSHWYQCTAFDHLTGSKDETMTLGSKGKPSNRDIPDRRWLLENRF